MNEFLDASLRGDYVVDPLFEESEEEQEDKKLLSTDSTGTLPEPLEPPPPIADNPYEDFEAGAQEFRQEREDAQVESALNVGLEESEATIASNKFLAKELELPVDVVANDPAEAAKQLSIKQSKDLLEFSPETRKILMDFDKSYGLAESVPELAWWESVSDTFEEWSDDFMLGITKGDKLTEMGMLISEAKKTDNPGTKAGLMKQVAEIKKEMAELRTSKNPIAGAGAFESLGKLLPMMIEGYKQSLPVAIEGAGINALAATPGGPGAQALFAGVGFGASMAGGMTLFMGELEEALSYDDLLEEGISEKNADIISRGVGGINALLELTGGAAVLKPFEKPLIKLIQGELKEVLKDKTRAKAISLGMKAYALGIGGEVSTEVLQEVSNIAGVNIGQLMEGKELDVESEEGRAEIAHALIQIFDETGKAMLFLGMPGASLNVFSELKSVQRADDTEAFFKAMGENSPAIAEKLPEEYQEAVNEITKGGPVETVYIDAEKLQEVYQEDTVALAEELGIDEETLTDAIDSQGLLEVPIGTFATKIGRDEEALGKIQPHSKLDPTAQTPAEAANVKNDKGKLQRDFDASMEGIAEKEEFSQSANAVFEDERARLDATGRYTREQSEVNAMLHRNVMAQFAKEYDMLPHQFAKQVGFKQIDAINNPLEISRKEFNEKGLPLLPDSNDGFRILPGKNKAGIEVGETNISRRMVEENRQSNQEQTLDQQAAAVQRTPEFKEFFKDSKVVDESGEPLVVFHATDKSIESFNDGVIYFSRDADYDAANNRTGATNVIPAFLDAKNLTTISDADMDLLAAGDRGPNISSVSREELIEQGFDGAVNESGTEFAVFNGNQVKSIFNERPTQDPEILNQPALPSVEEIFGIEKEELNQGPAKKKKEKGPSRTQQTGSLKTIYPEINKALKEAIGRMDKSEAKMFKENMKKHAGTPWAAAAVRGMTIREFFFRALEGREDMHELLKSGLWGKENMYKYKMVKSFLAGEKTAEQFARNYSFIGDNRKAEMDISGSFKNCNPSRECAKHCYAADANARPTELLKAEFTEWVAEAHPDILADKIHAQYSATMQSKDGLALRINDKGDLSPAQVLLVKELNRQGIRMQIFSKRPDMLKKVSDFNLKMLSIDASNFELAQENPDMQLAVTITDDMTPDQIAEINDRVAVYLPVNLSGGELTRADVKERFPKTFNEMTKKLCPVDGGKMKTKKGTSYVNVIDGSAEKGLWTCGTCDKLGAAGCFYGKNQSENVRKIIAQVKQVNGPREQSRKEVDDAIARIEKDLKALKKRGELNEDEYAGIIRTLYQGQRNIRKEPVNKGEGQNNPEASGPVVGDFQGGTEAGQDAGGARSEARPSGPAELNQSFLEEQEQLNQEEVERVTPSWYYSQLAESFNNLPDKKTQDQSAKGWKQVIKKLGAKPKEIEWTGIYEWLDIKQLEGEKLSKADISNFLQNHGIEIETVEIDNTRGMDQDQFDDLVMQREEFLKEQAVEAKLSIMIQDEVFRLSKRDKDGNRVKGEPFEVTRKRIRDEYEAQVIEEVEVTQEFHSLAYDYVERNHGMVGDHDELGVDLEEYTLPGGEDKGNILLKFNQAHPQERQLRLVANKVKVHADSILGIEAGLAYYREFLGFDTWQEYVADKDLSRLPGHENAKNVLTEEEARIWNENRELLMRRVGDGRIDYKAGGFESHVFPGHENIVVWIRKQTRVVNGKKILLVDEIQSDFEKAVRQGDTTVKAPFTDKQSSYVGLAIKKIITYAVENGFDRVEWTTGSQQSERYPSLKEIARKVKYDPKTTELSIISTSKPRQPGGDKHFKSVGKVDDKKLQATIGKDAAEQLLATELQDGAHILDTGEIELSGAGMVDFYDRLIPDVAAKMIKSITGEKVEIESKDPAPDAYDPGRQPGFDLASIKESFEGDRVSLALFQKKKSDGAKRGALSFDPFEFTAKEKVLTLLEKADLTTYLHESGHYYFEVMRHLASQADAPKRIRDDMNTLLEFIGLDDNGNKMSLDTWNKMTLSERRAGHEKVADAFEKYLFEGRAPTKELQALFRKIKEWFIDVYKSLTRLKVPLTDDVRGVFDRMLASEAEIEAGKRSLEMEPLFKNNELIGMDPATWSTYNSIAANAEAEAKEKLNAADLRNMRWLQKARGKVLSEMQKDEKARRKGVQEEATRTVANTPIYRLRQYLQTPLEKKEKPKPNPKVVDPQHDSLFTAIAKLGGIKREEAVTHWGIDPKDKFYSGLGSGRPVIRAKGGKGIDEMGEALSELGYLPMDEVTGRWDPRDLEERFEEEHAGNLKYSVENEDFSISEAYENFVMSEEEKISLDAISGKGGKLNADLLRAEFEGREQIWEQLPAKGRHAMVVEEGGQAPAAVAEEFGFSSVDEMVQALIAAPDMREAVRAETDRRMIEIYGELDTPAQREVRVAEALANESRTRQVHAELTALSKSVGNQNILQSEAVEFAQEKISRMTPNQIRPAQHFAAERRANREVERALSKGNLKEAASHKRAAVLQYHFGREATKALAELERMVKYFNTFDRQGIREKIAKEQLDQIDGRLEVYDLRKSVSNRELEQREELAIWIKRQEELGFSPDIPEEIRRTVTLKHYRDVQMRELRGLEGSVRSIDLIGRNLKKAMILDKQKTIDEMVTEMTSRMRQTKKKRVIEKETERGLEPAKSKAREFLALHKKFSFHAKAFDGERDGGPAWQYLVRPLNERSDFATRRKAEATEALSKIYGKYTPAEQRQNNKKIFIPGINESLTKNAIISVALNWGNATNQDRVMSDRQEGGYGWSREDIEGPGGILSLMTLKDWQFVQEIWDYLETFWPEIREKEMRINGAQVEKVEALPVNTPFGQFRGGYYPIKYNSKLSVEASANEFSELYDQLKRGDIGRSTTRDGHTKSRVKGDVNRPIHLDHISVVMGHVNQVIHDLAFHELLIDMNRIINDKAFIFGVHSRFGIEVYDQIKATIKDVALGDVPALNVAEKLIGHLRVGASISAMGWNMSTASIQFLGLTQSMARVGVKWIIKGATRFFTGAENMENGYKWIMENSSMMRDRASTINREINEIRNRVNQTNVAGGLNSKMGDTYFYFIAKAQMMVDVPTWIGAYTKAIEEGVDGRPVKDEAEAIALADQAVKESQSSGDIMDQAGIQRGGPVWKLFTTFYSFFSSTYNNNAHAFNKTDFKNPYSVGGFAVDMLLINFFPVVLSLVIKDLLIRGECDGGNDLECVGKKLAVDEASYLLGTMVFLRELGGAIQGFAGYEGPPGLGFFSKASDLIVQIGQGEPDRAAWKALIGTLGTAFHKPAIFVTRILDSYMDAEEGKNVRPLAPLFGQAADSK